MSTTVIGYLPLFGDEQLAAYSHLGVKYNYCHHTRGNLLAPTAQTGSYGG